MLVRLVFGNGMLGLSNSISRHQGMTSSSHSTTCNDRDQRNRGIGEKSVKCSNTGVSTSINIRPVRNRILAVMLHTTRYAFKGKARLAADCGVAPSTICRLILGECSPSFALAATVTRVLEKQLGKTLDPRELVSLDGSYPTPSVCVLCGCRGCLPDEVYDEDEQVKPQYRHLKPGQWTTLSSEFIQQALNEECEDTESQSIEKIQGKEVL